MPLVDPAIPVNTFHLHLSELIPEIDRHSQQHGTTKLQRPEQMSFDHRSERSNKLFFPEIIAIL